MLTRSRSVISLFGLLAIPAVALASTAAAETPDLTMSLYGIIALAVFCFAYALVICEEVLHLRKSKPVMVAAGIIWAMVAISYGAIGMEEAVHTRFLDTLVEYAELMLFLLAAMTYINTLEERCVFDALRGFLVSRGFSFKKIFWITGILAFFISPIADNLTTALLMAAVVLAVAGGNNGNLTDTKRNFVILACINIVVAANAGGAFSPFGDITTLMVWQKGIIKFQEFFALFIPAIVNWFIPAFIMSFFVSKEQPPALDAAIKVQRGGFVVIGLFLLTITMAVLFHSLLHLPPVLGMMTGLGVLKLYGYYLMMTGEREHVVGEHTSEQHDVLEAESDKFDIFHQLQRAEWDTLMFFYGVILCVGGLAAFGYLAIGSQFMYEELGALHANILVGIASAIIDNIPVMYAVLTMNPDMNHAEWLLVTLTAGVGGSLLSIGSAAGVGLMGQARGIYTFFAHLKWTWAIALGYAASIWVHIQISGM